jgi:hypothetical protein
MRIRSYSELRDLTTLEERYHYLALRGQVGEATFGYDRWMNQQFYRSREWRLLREEVILRDNGCDLGLPGFEINHGLYVHHMNPMSAADLSASDPDILNPEFLITVTHRTHNAIHYGDESLLPQVPVERRPGDTTLW